MGKEQKGKGMSLEDFQALHGSKTSARMKGVIKNVNERKFGFIKSTTPKDIHFNFSEVDKQNLISVGAEVEFDIKEAEKGATAIKIIITKAGSNMAAMQNTQLQNHEFPELFVPKDTKEAISRDKIENFALKFQKFARFDISEKGKEKFSFYKTDKKDENKSYDDTKLFNFPKIPFKALNGEIAESAQTLYPVGNVKLELEIDWRLAIGLGTESVYETSMTLHPVYGFPYIPGQAVKGITRSWIINEEFGGNEGRAISESETFCKIFGCPKDVSIDERDANGEVVKVNGKVKKNIYTSILKKEYQGSLVFFDAFPTSAPNLKVDVMNPHYGPYYSDNSNTKPPADYYNPVPIFFLTVEETKFQFIIGINGKDNIKVSDFDGAQKTLLEIAESNLKEALQNQGVGAKSAVGYGYFS